MRSDAARDSRCGREYKLCREPSTAMPPSHGTPRTLTKLASGGNSEIYAWHEDRVLKLFRPGFSTKVAGVEFHHARLAHDLGIPTPRAEGMVEIEGRAGIVYERCHGPTIYQMLVTAAAPAERLAQVFFEFQQAIHRCQDSRLPELRQRMASKIPHARGVSNAVKQQAIALLRKLPAGQSICHGDFHPFNILFRRDEDFTVLEDPEGNLFCVIDKPDASG